MVVVGATLGLGSSLSSPGDTGAEGMWGMLSSSGDTLGVGWDMGNASAIINTLVVVW